jgi:hypothetical protein
MARVDPPRFSEEEEAAYERIRAGWRELAVQILHCPACGASPPEKCTVTRGPNEGQETSYVHGQRFAALHAAWWAGVKFEQSR